MHDGKFRMDKILHATDFMENSRLALDYAVGFADRFSALLTIVHAFAPSSEALEAEYVGHRPSVSRVEALSRLDALAASVRRTGVNAATVLREGEPAEAVLQAVGDVRCDLLVLGTHGIYRGAEHFLIGSNAEKLLLSAPCPALTVGKRVLAGIDVELAFKDILFISDLKSEDAHSLRTVFQMAEAFGSPVNVCVVGAGGPKEAEQHLGRLVEQCAKDPSFPAAPGYQTVLVDDPEQAICRAEETVRSLIVTSVHKLGRIERHLRSSFAFELAARASSPVLSIPAAAHSSE